MRVNAGRQHRFCVVRIRTSLLVQGHSEGTARLGARLKLIWEQLRSSYWFVPTIMATLAVALSMAAIELDTAVGEAWLLGTWWLYEPESARNLLSTVSGSMLGVAGVTFSITIVSVVYASGQYGPRVISNFMADKGNQITLGTFISTFLYCLLVMRVVRESLEPIVGEAHASQAFVPHIAVTGALVLTVASIAVLIYFIHHVPRSIHVSNLVAEIGYELQAQIESVFPERIGRSACDLCDCEAERRAGSTDREKRVCAAANSGYIQSVDGDALLRIATEAEIVLRLDTRPGDFTCRGDSLLSAWPAEKVTDAIVDQLRPAFAIGVQRTALQDLRFPADELAEIAVRALSPGVNDPFTAIACIDWLSSALKSLAERETPSALRVGADGEVRVLAPPTTFGDLVRGSVAIVAQHAQRDPTVARHLGRRLHEVGNRTEDPERLRVLRVALSDLRGDTKAETSDSG